MIQTIITNSHEETRQLGESLIQELGDSRILTLHGNLGSGKTTFIQGLAKGLNITKKIISPTFIIMRTYAVPLDIGHLSLDIRYFYHIDLYRLNTPSDINDLGILELLSDQANLLAIEWPEKIEKLLPKKRTDIHFTYLEKNTRSIIIDKKI